MKTKIILAALTIVAIAGAAHSDEGAGPAGKKFGGGMMGGFMEKLTDEQKACIDEQGCPKIEFKKSDGEKPDKEAMKESRECMKKAFETCGVEMPERPARPEGDRSATGGESLGSALF